MANLAKGKHFMVNMDGEIIGYATSCSLEITTDMTDVAAYKWQGGDASWKESIRDKMSWTVSSDHLATVDLGDYNIFYNAMIKDVPVDIEFVAVSLNTGSAGTIPGETGSITGKVPKYAGKAFITSLSLNADEGSEATYSVSFQGTGELKQTLE